MQIKDYTIYFEVDGRNYFLCGYKTPVMTFTELKNYWGGVIVRLDFLLSPASALLWAEKQLDSPVGEAEDERVGPDLRRVRTDRAIGRLRT